MHRPALASAVLLVGVLLHAGAASALSTVTFDPSRTTLRVGETLELAIYADMTDPIVGWGLDLLIDPAHLSVAGAPVIGPDWTGVSGQDGDALAGAAFPDGLTGNVLLATLTLSAESLGLSAISIEFTDGDATEGFAFDPDFATGFDSVQLPAPLEINVVPEPGTAALVALGMLGLAARSRRD